MQDRYRVIVIGGGHAGVEAAWAAANLLGAGEAHGSESRATAQGSEIRAAAHDSESRATAATVALVTLDPAKIGVMPCNPAIGGLAKGQLVREIDALGGLMGLAADATGIQFKVLNASKGPAVRGPRCQSDKHAYAEAVQNFVRSRPEIDVIAGAVEEIVTEGGVAQGVVVQATTGERLALGASSVVLTTGTFMRGLMHTGQAQTPGGRQGEAATSAISASLSAMGFELGRLKTGTPPRLSRRSIDWENLPIALGDETPTPFSDLSARADRPGRRFPGLRQIECRQTETNPAIHDIIRANLDKAPIFSGQIDSVGPRYCPSIEDKVVRFADREGHGVFLEPESLRDDSVYCNGISTSLPADVQEQMVHAMPGCEKAQILRAGYAVEYDMVRPHQILATGEAKLVERLFLAGQINGTSGYEEAAAQGLVAGVNAARRARGEGEWTVGRDQAYIGVLMDDLVTKTPVEPYRMFTSRAEHRLLLRADNAADRLTPIARDLGLLDSTELGRTRRDLFATREREIASARIEMDRPRGPEPTLAHVVRQDRLDIEGLRRELAEAGAPCGPEPAATLHAEARYQGYIARQVADVKRRAEMERRRLPVWIDYRAMPSLRNEAREALDRFRPSTFGQASRLEGLTPSDITLLAVLVDRAKRVRSTA